MSSTNYCLFLDFLCDLLAFDILILLLILLLLLHILLLISVGHVALFLSLPTLKHAQLAKVLIA